MAEEARALMNRSGGYGGKDEEIKGTRGRGDHWGILTILLVLAFILNLLILASKLDYMHLPGNQQGYEPPQPIAFSHLVHAGEVQIPCLYCHRGAALGQYAGIPSADQCMNCHRFILAPLGAVREEERIALEENREPLQIVSTEIEKILDALGLDSELEPSEVGHPIVWNRIHKLPDYVYFDHSAHTSVNIDCSRCHGTVETMENTRQVESLSMGWCVECHREFTNRVVAGRRLRPSLDCITCHF
jgi:hypothetical protein